MTNPYVEEHVQAELAFDPMNARHIVESEYANAPDPIPCTCGGTAFYKATIGAMKCTTCGALYFGDGDPVDPVPALDGPPATERQVDYVKSLVRDRAPDRMVDYSTLTKRTASALIDELVAIKPPAKTLIRNGGYSKPVHDDIIVTSSIPDGTYTVIDGAERRTIRLRNADWASDLPKGSQVAEFLSGPDNTADFTGFAFVVKGKARVWRRYRSESTLVDMLTTLLNGGLDNAAQAGYAYALASSRCYRCNRTLTVPASIHRGLGPVCAQGGRD